MMIFRLLASIALFSCCSFAPVDAKLEAPSHLMEAPEDNQLPKSFIKYELMEQAELYLDHFGVSDHMDLSKCDFFKGLGCTVKAGLTGIGIAACPVTFGAACIPALAGLVIFLVDCRVCIGNAVAIPLCSAAYVAVKAIRTFDPNFNDSAVRHVCKGLGPYEEL